VYIAFVCPEGGYANCLVSIDYTNSTPTWDGSWNLLVWIAGDNNLAYEGYADLQEMEAVGSTNSIRVLAGYDIDPAYLDVSQQGADQVRFIKVVADNDPNVINTSGDPANMSFPREGYNSADPAHVAEFVQWAADNFPADHTILCLWNHGDGWHRSTSGVVNANAGKDARPHYPIARLRKQGVYRGRQASGILADDTDSGTFYLTTNHSIVDALSGHHFDMVLFDACNMGNLESLFDFRGTCDWMAGSETLVPGEGYDYAGALNAWTSGFPLKPEEIGTHFVDTQIAYYVAQDIDVSMGVFNSLEIGNLVDSLKTFAAAVTANAPTEHDAVTTALAQAFEPYGGDGQRDLQGFLTDYAGLTPKPELAQAANDSLASLGNAIHHFNQNLTPEANGISAWLPGSDFYGMYLEEYQSTAFDIYTSWSAMLEATGASAGPTLDSAEWQPGDWIEVSWADSANDIDLGVRDPSGYSTGPYYDSETANLSFSTESTISGQPFESAELKAGAAGGQYLVDATRWDELAGDVEVTVRLYDGSDVLKHDFGNFSLGLYADVKVAVLIYGGTLAVSTWVPGDRVEITWADPARDADLGISDPQGYYSSPYIDFQTANVLFSEDSYSSGLGLEFAKLKAKAVGGAYFIALEDWEGGPALDMAVKIYDAQNNLKTDLGVFNVPGDSYETYVRLDYTPPPE
jgi:Clostripain family